jgi:hypothetical protein
VTTVKFIGGCVHVYIASRLIKVRIGYVLKNLWPPLEAATLMGIIVFAVKKLFWNFEYQTLAILITCVLIGICSFIILLRIRHVALIDELLTLSDRICINFSSFLRSILFRNQVKKIS